MNDKKLDELINTVFDKLESLSDKEFRENLSKYYDHPLTELLSQSERFKDNSYESPYIPFASVYTSSYESAVFTAEVPSCIATSVSYSDTHKPYELWLNDTLATTFAVEENRQIIRTMSWSPWISIITDVKEEFSWAQAT